MINPITLAAAGISDERRRHNRVVIAELSVIAGLGRTHTREQLLGAVRARIVELREENRP